MLQKEHPLAPGGDRNWEDIISSWDELSGNGQGDDEMLWASDAEKPGGLFAPPSPSNGHNSIPIPSDEVGPMGEAPDYSDAIVGKVIGLPPLHQTTVELQNGSVNKEVAEAGVVQPARSADLDTELPGTPSTGSDSATEERLGLAMNSLRLYSADEPTTSVPHRVQADDGDERGRSTLPTPLEWNDPIKSTDM